uniref:Uncharacterized protein n=1 Tax=Rhizophora mucronata TaxID=61149 RepID=A0A2P2Q6V5_RHIMU
MVEEHALDGCSKTHDGVTEKPKIHDQNSKTRKFRSSWWQQ